MYKLIFDKEAIADREYWKTSGNKAAQRKIAELLQSISATPFKGTGDVEQLKYQKRNVWSRRINKANRITYIVSDTKEEVYIIRMRGHYDDK